MNVLRKILSLCILLLFSLLSSTAFASTLVASAYEQDNAEGYHTAAYVCGQTVGTACVLATVPMAHGLDTYQTGWRKLITGEHHVSFGAQALMGLGLSEGNATLLYDVVALSGDVIAARALLKATSNPVVKGLGGSVDNVAQSGGATNWRFVTSRTEFDQRFSGFPSQAHADDAWAAYRSTSTDTRPIAMGRLEATEVADSLGFQRLNVKNWSPEVNDAWVQGGIDARRQFFVASDPNISNYRAAGVFDANGQFVGRGQFPETVFFREMRQLRDAGYRLEGNFMVPPP